MSVYTKESQQKAQACVIWMHGLGASASDMAGLAEELLMGDVELRHVFLDAPRRPVTINGGMVMPAWYDIVGMELVDRVDVSGIAHSESIIREIMEAQLKAGFRYEQIFLAGFSQGGAMALQTALHTPHRLGGVIALSAYLPLGYQSAFLLDKKTPFFFASGLQDTVVLPAWTQGSKELILAKGYADLVIHQYPMEHSICYEELLDISQWLKNQVLGVV